MGMEANAGFMNIVIMGVFVLGMYFLLIRPSSKRKKQEEQMRSNLSVGDEITTIGGIVGRIVAIKDSGENYVIETGVDRAKIKIRKWAVASADNVKEQAKEVKKEEKKEKTSSNSNKKDNKDKK